MRDWKKYAYRGDPKWTAHDWKAYMTHWAADDEESPESTGWMLPLVAAIVLAAMAIIIASIYGVEL